MVLDFPSILKLNMSLFMSEFGLTISSRFYLLCKALIHCVIFLDFHFLGAKFITLVMLRWIENVSGEVNGDVIDFFLYCTYLGHDSTGVGVDTILLAPFLLAIGARRNQAPPP